MITLRSYVGGRWIAGDGERARLVNPATEEAIAEAGTGGVDMEAALEHARAGGVALREMTYLQRGELLRAMARLIHARRDELIEPAIANGGNTRSDAKFDIDGASGTLAYYAELGAGLGDVRVLADGDGAQLGRSARLWGQHVLVPRHGVAVQVNAFNFPGWGFAEKAACALLAGMPVIAKPATATALLAYRMVEAIVEARILPEGALGFLAGGAGDLLRRLGGQDVLAFTGSSETGAHLRALREIAGRSVRVNVEADSLNAAVLAPDVAPGSPTFDLFVADVAKEMTQKAGQKCTAFRRLLVPSPLVGAVESALVERLGAVKVGDPAREEVTMGPLATAQQLRDVRAGLARLRAEVTSVFGGDGAVEPIGLPSGRGYFVGPVLLRCNNPDAATAVHQLEVFGPVATIVPFDGETRSAVDLVRRGGGMLQTSIYGDDRDRLAALALGIAPFVGRLVIGSEKIAGQATAPGAVLPQLVHGGPGRAGGGEELGGLRGLSLYLQRTALQGDKPLVESIARQNRG